MNTETTARLAELKRAATALAVVLPGEDGTEFELERMRIFLARVVIAPPDAIKITGNPETDENTDLLTSRLHPEDASAGVLYASLCKGTALMIDSILAGEIDLLPSGEPDIERGKAMFREFVAHPVKLYP
jgi:hypothetical protein